MDRCASDLPEMLDLDNFPVQALDEAQRKAGIGPDDFQRFGDAWIGIAVRLEAVARHATAYGRAYRAQETPDDGKDPDPEARRRATVSRMRDLDRHLFDTISNAQSAIELYAFAVYAIAGMVRPRQFPLSSGADLARVNPKSTLERLGAADGFPRDAVTRGLRRLLASDDYARLRRMRNLLLHRSAPRGWHVPAQSELTDDSALYVLELGDREGGRLAVDSTAAGLVGSAVVAAVASLMSPTERFVRDRLLTSGLDGTKSRTKR
jgi:hypothetical protein